MDADESFLSGEFFGFFAVFDGDGGEEFGDVFGEGGFADAGRSEDDDVSAEKEGAFELLFGAFLAENVGEWVLFEEYLLEVFFHRGLLPVGAFIIFVLELAAA